MWQRLSCSGGQRCHSSVKAARPPAPFKSGGLLAALYFACSAAKAAARLLLKEVDRLPPSQLVFSGTSTVLTHTGAPQLLGSRRQCPRGQNCLPIAAPAQTAVRRPVQL